MDAKELHRILAQGEGLRIEFKEAQNGVPDSLYDTVSAFLNREGGIILLGVDDNGSVLGLNGQNLMQLKQNAVTALNNPDVINPPFALAVSEVVYGNDILLYIRVPVSSFIHKHGQVIPLDLSYKNVDDLDELALQLVRSWAEKSGELASFRFVINKDITTYDLKKVRS